MTDELHFRWKDNVLWLKVRVAPKAKRNKVGEVSGGRLKIAVTAPPTDGKANRQLLKFLAGQFGIPAARVSIASGLSARDKTVCVERPARLPAEFQLAPP